MRDWLSWKNSWTSWFLAELFVARKKEKRHLQFLTAAAQPGPDGRGRPIDVTSLTKKNQLGRKWCWWSVGIHWTLVENDLIFHAHSFSMSFRVWVFLLFFCMFFSLLYEGWQTTACHIWVPHQIAQVLSSLSLSLFFYYHRTHLSLVAVLETSHGIRQPSEIFTKYSFARCILWHSLIHSDERRTRGHWGHRGGPTRQGNEWRGENVEVN